MNHHHHHHENNSNQTPKTHDITFEDNLLPHRHHVAPSFRKNNPYLRAASRAGVFDQNVLSGSIVSPKMHRRSQESQHRPSIVLKAARGMMDQPFHSFKKIINFSWGARLLDIIVFITVMVSIILYIIGTYLDEIPLSFYIANIVIGVIFGIDLCLRLFASLDTTEFLLRIMTWIDIISLVPTFSILLYWFESNAFRIIVAVCSIIRFFKIYRLSSIGTAWFMNDALRKTIQSILFMVISVVLTTAAFVQLIEEDEINFHNSVYFMVITGTTVGYGDITPDRYLSKLVVMIFIFAMLTYIPIQSSRLFSFLKTYKRSTASYHISNEPHVVLVGNVTEDNALAFLYEFCHEAYDNTQTNVVILSNKAYQLRRSVLTQRRFYSRVHCITGSAMNGNDLSRAAVHEAAAVFIITDKQASDAKSADTESVLRCLSINSFLKWKSLTADSEKLSRKKRLENVLKRGWNLISIGKDRKKKSVSSTNVCIQLLRPKSKHLLQSISPELIISITELKMNLISQSCLCPGYSTLMGNLFRNESKISLDIIRQYPWISDYLRGLDHEIYEVTPSTDFHGLTLSEAIMILSIHFDAILIGVINSESGNITLGDLQHVITEMDIFICICESRSAIAGVSTFLQSQSTHKRYNLSIEHDRPKSRSYQSVQLKSDQNTIDENENNLHQDISFSRNTHDNNPKNDDETSNTEKPPTEAENDNDMVVIIHPNSANENNTVQDSENSIFNDEPENENNDETDNDNNDIDIPDENEKEPSQFYIAEDRLESNLDQLPPPPRDSQVPLKDHIVVSGEWRKLQYFVAPLRRRHLRHFAPIIIWRNTKPPPKYAQILSIFPKVYHAQDMRSCCITSAKAVVTLYDQTKENMSIPGSEDNYAIDARYIRDFKSLMNALRIPSLLKTNQTFYITELIYLSNAKLLQGHISTASDEEHQHLSLHYAAGHVYSDTFIDSLMCQAFYNRHIMAVMQQLFTTIDVRHIRVPTQYHGRSWGEAFDYFIRTSHRQQQFEEQGEDSQSIDEYNGIPLGLYRRMNERNPESMRFVYTHPPRSAVLRETDLVFIMTPNRMINDTN